MRSCHTAAAGALRACTTANGTDTTQRFELHSRSALLFLPSCDRVRLKSNTCETVPPHLLRPFDGVQLPVAAGRLLLLPLLPAAPVALHRSNQCESGCSTERVRRACFKFPSCSTPPLWRVVPALPCRLVTLHVLSCFQECRPAALLPSCTCAASAASALWKRTCCSSAAALKLSAREQRDGATLSLGSGNWSMNLLHKSSRRQLIQSSSESESSSFEAAARPLSRPPLLARPSTPAPANGRSPVEPEVAADIAAGGSAAAATAELAAA